MSYKQCQFHSSAIQTLGLQCLISVFYFASETPVSYTKAPNIPALHLVCLLLIVIQQFHTCFGDIHCFPTFTGYTPASLPTPLCELLSPPDKFVLPKHSWMCSLPQLAYWGKLLGQRDLSSSYSTNNLQQFLYQCYNIVPNCLLHAGI